MDCRVRSPHVSASSGERLSALQMVAATMTTVTLMRNATTNARLHSARKYLQAAYPYSNSRGLISHSAMYNINTAAVESPD